MVDYGARLANFQQFVDDGQLVSDPIRINKSTADYKKGDQYE